MAHRVTTREGKKLDAVPKQIPRTGVAMLGFRQFLLRGLQARGEWSLVAMAWNIKPMFTLSPA
jgi:hypothetical protein